MFKSCGYIFFCVQYFVSRFLHVRLRFFTKHFFTHLEVDIILIDPVSRWLSVIRAHQRQHKNYESKSFNRKTANQKKPLSVYNL